MKKVFALLTVALINVHSSGYSFPFLDYLLSLPTVATAVLLLTAAVFKTFPYAKVLVKQIVSILIGVGIGGVGYYYNAGYFEGETLVYSLLSGLGAALMANGLYSYEIIAGILQLMKLKLPTKK
jgi:hypothetical protein